MSRCGSDSDDSSDLDMDPLIARVSQDDKPCPRLRSSSDPDGRKRKDKDKRKNKNGNEKGDKPLGDKREKAEKDADTEKEMFQLDTSRVDEKRDTEHKEEAEGARDTWQIQIQMINDLKEQQKEMGQEGKLGGGAKVRAAQDQPPVSEASDSCQSDSRVLTSPSSDSLDALEEDDLLSCSSAIHPSTHSHLHHPFQLHHYSHGGAPSHHLAPPPAHSHPLIQLTPPDKRGGCRRSGDGADPQLLVAISPHPGLQHAQKCPDNLCPSDSALCFAELSRLVDFLPSPPEASEEEDEEEELRRRRLKVLKELNESVRREGEGGSVSGEGCFKEHHLSISPSSPSSNMEFVFNFDQSDARCYYNLCSNITPDSARSLSQPTSQTEGEEAEVVEEDSAKTVDFETVPILHPPPGFRDSSSDEEFFDARDGFMSPEDPTSGALPRGDLFSQTKADLMSLLSNLRHTLLIPHLLPSSVEGL